MPAFLFTQKNIPMRFVISLLLICINVKAQQKENEYFKQSLPGKKLLPTLPVL
jgi:hypothetical protein